MVDFILVCIFLFISLAITVLSFVVTHNIKRNCSVEVTAVIEKKEIHHNYNAHRNYHVAILGYDYNGVHYTSTARTRTGNQEVGNQVTIRLNPDNPQKNYQKNDLLLPNLALIIGISMTCISLFLSVQILLDIVF